MYHRHRHQTGRMSRGCDRNSSGYRKSGLCAIATRETPETTAKLATSATNTSAATNVTLDARTQAAMVESINDEYHARAFYTAVIHKFGHVRPFINIVVSEDRHVKLWNSLFTKYGLPIPEDTFAGKLTAPDTLKAACEMGVKGEIANVEMYDRFLSFVKEADLRAAFIQLRHVSQHNHLRAFQRCASNR